MVRKILLVIILFLSISGNAVTYINDVIQPWESISIGLKTDGIDIVNLKTDTTTLAEIPEANVKEEPKVCLIIERIFLWIAGMLGTYVLVLIFMICLGYILPLFAEYYRDALYSKKS